MQSPLVGSLFVLALSGVTQAWGAIGHQTTGAIAQSFITENTTNAVRDLLPADWRGSLSRSTTWADEVKYGRDTKEKYAWASKLHYVDAEDDAPKSCSYVQERDCPDGQCVVGAIANFSSQLSNCKLEKEPRSEALKFVTHFFGDVSQPLHACGRLRGGNEATVAAFDNRSGRLNLHSLWDTYVIEKRLNTVFGGSFDKYVQYLLTQARGPLAGDVAQWTQCFANAGDNKDLLLKCPIQWATESDALNCEIVWKLYDANPDADLGKEYYEAAWPVIERQLIKSGVRMAGLLENIFKDGTCNVVPSPPPTTTTTPSEPPKTTTSAPSTTTATTTTTTTSEPTIVPVPPVKPKKPKKGSKKGSDFVNPAVRERRRRSYYEK